MFGGRGRTEGQERVEENINQCGMGVWLSGSALSARQIGKHFNGFLSTAPSHYPLWLYRMHSSHATIKNLTSICVHTPTEREGRTIILPTPEYIIQSWHLL